MSNKFVDINGVEKIRDLVQEDIQTAANKKQDIINDLETIRSGAADGATAVQPEDLVWASEFDIRELFHPMPIKGDIIVFDALGDGTQKRFRVWKRDGQYATLVDLECITTVWSTWSNYDSQGQIYMNSALDTACNSTYYNNLSAATKAAIIDTNRQQEIYRFGNNSSQTPAASSLNFKYNSTESYYAYVSKSGTRAIGNRKCYALGFDDLIEYFEVSAQGGVIQMLDVKNLFAEHFTSSNSYLWLDSANPNSPDNMFSFYNTETTERFPLYVGTNDGKRNQYGAPVAFTIDLSKIDFTVEGGNN